MQTHKPNPSVSGDRLERRTSGFKPVDDFPTPPWGTRAFIENILKPLPGFKPTSVWEPACNRGYMASVLHENFVSVTSTDFYNYGFGQGCTDFTDPNGWVPPNGVDWVISNPPFSAFQEFAERALSVAKVGVALLGPLTIVSSLKRFDLYQEHPPALFCPYAERLPMHAGRYDPDGDTAASYGWVVWIRGWNAPESVRRIPPGSKEKHYRESDADLPELMTMKGIPRRHPRVWNL